MRSAPLLENREINPLVLARKRNQQGVSFFLWQPLLEAMREKLDGCIGCGCLSLDTCAIYNLDDEAALLGTGPRWLLGDRTSGGARATE